MRRPAKRRQRALRPRDRAPKSYISLEPSSLRRAGATPRRREAARPATSERNEAPAAARAAGESRRKQQLPDVSVVLRARRGGPAGVEERGIGARGLPRNLGDLVLSATTVRLSAVSPSKGTTDAERDGGRGVVAARSTEEAGIAARATQWREGAVESRNRWRERGRGGHRAPEPLNATRTDSELGVTSRAGARSSVPLYRVAKP